MADDVPGTTTAGRWLVEQRRRRGLTQPQVADAVGLNFSAVSNWERGLNLPRERHMPALARLFGIDLGELRRALGVYAGGGAPAVGSVSDALWADPHLSSEAKRALLALYDLLRSGQPDVSRVRHGADRTGG